MSYKIEEAFNDCFERLSAGESLDSCLHSYPQYAAELDLLLRTSFDIKRRAYPIQPRPEFKYWSKIRLQGVQDYVSRQPVQDKPASFNLRRNLSISMAALLVFVIASSGTVAASSDAMPDEPLYGVKIAVEQAQVTFAVSDADRAEVYAHLAEKRAGEIVAMARQGKADKVITTTAKMDYQLDQAEHFISKYEEANADTNDTAPAAPSVLPAPVIPAAPAAPSVLPAPVIPAAPAAPSVLPVPVLPPAPAAMLTADNTSAPNTTGGQQDNVTLPAKPLPPATRAATNINRVKNTMNTTTAKSLAILQNALEKAPDSAKPALQEVIQRTRIANERAQQQLNLDSNQKAQPLGNTPKIIPPAPLDKPIIKKVLPRHGVDNQTNTVDNHDDDNK